MEHRWRWGWLAMIAAGIAIGIGVDRVLIAQQSGITRTELTRVDVPGSSTHEAVMAVAEIAPGASSGGISTTAWRSAMCFQDRWLSSIRTARPRRTRRDRRSRTP